MNQTKANCLEIEGLLPLYVGSDLEPADGELVGQHVKACASCGEALERAQAARAELRKELGELVDGHEPQLWPAIRESLASEGLIGGSPAGTDSQGATERAPLLRSVSLLAASLALVFGLNHQFNTGTPGDQPTTPVGQPADHEPVASSLTKPNPQPGGLTPMGLDEVPLFNQAREAILRDSSGGFGPVTQDGRAWLPIAPQDQGNLASDVSFQ